MSTGVDESIVEEAALTWLGDVGYAITPGTALAPDDPAVERSGYERVVLETRLREAIAQLNPDLPAEALDEAHRKIVNVSSPNLVDANHALHSFLVHGVTVEYQRADGSLGYDPVRIIDFENPDENDWLAANQVIFASGNQTRRADVVLFLNGLPLVVIELKNAANEEATLLDAYQQLQTYKHDLPDLFTYNALLAVSDGLSARLGTLTAGFERFAPWVSADDEQPTPDGRPSAVVPRAPVGKTALEVLIRGVLAPRKLLDMIRHYTVFEDDGETVAKKIAGYHQIHAVARGLEATLVATGPDGDRKVGVVWHTQGSGKSLTMVFYAGRLVVHPEMRNPTIVIVTDRNDLDEQLFGTFARCKELLRQDPVQARDRAHLRELLQTNAGGIVFTTIQKIIPEEKGDTYPELNERSNIVVIADEAHRSQYDFIDGFARHLHDALPNASFVGFTGTPVELADKSTRGVFGDHISVYDIARAVDDGATVRIYYEGRMVPLRIDDKARDTIDDDFEEVTEGEELAGKEKLKTKWAALEALAGADPRIARIARDLVDHFEARLTVMEGKAMLVCMSRRICADIYEAIRKLRPDWHDEDDTKGAMKVVITGGASDVRALQPHIRTKAKREALAKRFKDPDDPLKLVIVRDMWLTGFDVPCLHTMYIDKPMQGHGLMQAIARVNRVFRDKPGGLVVDYIGLATRLKEAMHTYSEAGGEGQIEHDQAEAVRIARREHEVCLDLFEGFDLSGWVSASAADRISLLKDATDHVLQQNDGKERYLKAVAKLSSAFALAVPHPEALAIRDDVGFFQAVRAVLVKNTVSEQRPPGNMDHAIRQLVSKAVASDEVVDLFAKEGIKRQDISILSEDFLAELRDMPQKNLAAEMLRKLIDDEVKVTARRNVVNARKFSELLDAAIRRYRNRALSSREVIEELIGLAREMQDARGRGESLGMSDDEVAFYDALHVDETAESVLGDGNLRVIARELVESVRKNVTIDWTVKESVRAKLRVIVKRILRKHGYPPGKQDEATRTVLEQAELFSDGWLAS
ncbi:type I restriction endonuclease subunit R [Polyangium fumosum]|uniref:Type I restriction enzyme endonuclease subunit n=1 Tax=Polyangium fumosum TaxID=889272 RepID=A0A4U1IUA6_9BACT|nr:type I restriction endonuclease subunit R [Polyangium fumosum]